jgi:hypothetical protein
MKSKIIMLVLVLALGGVAQAQGTYIVFAEDFESLTLGPSPEEAPGTQGVWTDTPPPGWIIDDTGVPGVGDPATDGMADWAGWAFTDKKWWTSEAGDQRRSEYTLGQGTVAVADPDEWDDLSHPFGTYNTYLSTPAIDISRSKAGTVQLKFDSSWRPQDEPEGAQKANITVSYDGGSADEILRWESHVGEAYFKDDNSTNETIIIDLDNPSGAQSMVLTFGLFNAGNNWWWAIDNIMVTAAQRPEVAYNPNPPNGAVEVPLKTVLSWTPGDFVGGLSPKHKVILNDNFDDVSNGTAIVATQDSNSYDPAGLLNFGTTYYWRIDEANSTIGWDEGGVWQFTTEPAALPIDANNITAIASSQFNADIGPENTINGSGLDENDLHSIEQTDVWISSITGPQPTWIQYEFNRLYKLHQMLVWNHNTSVEPVIGFGFRDATIEYSDNGTDYTTLGTTHEFARAPGVPGYAYNTTVDLGGVVAKYVKITANSNWGGMMPQYGLSEVRFFCIPVFAREPDPASEATYVDVDVTLGFRAGREAAQHDVYLSTDEQAVIDGTAPVATVTETSYGPLTLDLDTTHYWRVDEVNEAEIPATWQGDLWNFTTTDHLIVDDFESYNDLDTGDPESKRIFNVWIDGYEVPTNGSLVGYAEAPFAEQNIVHGGKQSMPFFYSNTGGAAYSEAELTLTPAQNWTASGVVTLAVHFYGTIGNTGQLYVKINGTKVSYDGEASNLALIGWQAWNIDLASSGAGLQNVTKLAVGIDGNGASGTLYFDDIGLYPYSRQLVIPTEPSQAGLVGHWKFDEGSGTLARDYSGQVNDGTFQGNPKWVSGKVNGALKFDGDDDQIQLKSVFVTVGSSSNTLCLWVKVPLAGTEGLGTTERVGIVLGNDPDSPSANWELHAAGQMRLWWNGGQIDHRGTTDLRDDTWHHLTWVRDKATNTNYMYIDGHLETMIATLGTDITFNTTHCIGGDNRPDPPNFHGLMDDVQVYDRALSQEEIAWLAGQKQPFDKPF